MLETDMNFLLNNIGGSSELFGNNECKDLIMIKQLSYKSMGEIEDHNLLLSK